MVLAAAVQLDAKLGDVSANLVACHRLADEAGDAGAKIIALPEFFTTGIGFLRELVDAALPVDGPAADLLCDVARRHGAMVGGSFLCRDVDGHIRNAYLLADPTGIVGRHDKDLPTMWENAIYTGGDDDGVLTCGELSVGAAVCWELMRTRTVRRMRGRVDLAMTGSGWWSIPPWPPRRLFDRLEKANAATARRAATDFARYIGAPVVHAAHVGELECPMPWLPVRYRGHFEGNALITDATGTVVAQRSRADGEGVVLADITLGRATPVDVAPHRFWLHRRGVLPAAVWHYQRLHGRRWYERNAVNR
ncbi:carbon-nitrogen hydrolase family protein [Arthrobacter sp. SLBN-53]|uniref:carbon-nitrogen hydrolase family protein n=1 Tax=Arthrobacter sp. SLBN-53 TaxID=2768412 RepID=UPI0011504D3D|nr:carbon-nitrogen hydrolase family protein [Arthrobacter sp. SLBN-53]TQK31836.1 putative amidohydrolase [Arthrobacter sp. SLBN-53]